MEFGGWKEASYATVASLYSCQDVVFGYGLECRSNLQQAGGHDMK